MEINVDRIQSLFTKKTIPGAMQLFISQYGKLAFLFYICCERGLSVLRAGCSHIISVFTTELHLNLFSSLFSSLYSSLIHIEHFSIH